MSVLFLLAPRSPQASVDSYNSERGADLLKFETTFYQSHESHVLETTSNHFKLFMLTRDKILHRKPIVFITHLGVCHCSVREPALNSRDTPRLPLTHGNATKLY